MPTMATTHVAVAMGQVETAGLPLSSHSFFPITFFIVYGQVPFFSVYSSLDM